MGMSKSCCAPASATVEDPQWRRVLWIAFTINGGFFLGEIIAGAAAGSAALQADALDFLGDSANYAISLGVVGMALGWRSRAALAKGWTMLAFAAWVLATTAWHAYVGTLPKAEMMGVVGFVALAANGGVALMLWRHRAGDANRRSAWICSRNDAIGNVIVLIAAAGVFGTRTGWTDVIAAAAMATLELQGGWQIIRQARAELRPDHSVRSISVGE
jgi:Co/Zn/Cd efflux system component